MGSGREGAAVTAIGRVGEGLARRINRRQGLKRLSAAVFGAVAAWTVEGFRGSGALAGHCGYVTSGDCSCNPPYGLYCSRIDESYCSGSACSGGCWYDESYRYVGACWCSAECEFAGDDGSPLVGYYQCCDCNCYGQQCACREFVQTGFGPPPEEDDDDNAPPGGFPEGFPFD